MRRKLLGLAVVLVALAAMVNALALESATISGSTVSIPIVNSSTALIAIKGATLSPDPDVTVTESAGIATISVSTGLQPDSTYTFGNVLTITNNSSTNGVVVSLSVDAASLSGTGIDAITFYNGGSEFVSATLDSGQSVTLAMTIDVSATASLGTASPTITVSATTP